MADLDIILPVYNPLPEWEQIVIERFLSLEKLFPDHRFRLIVVNDGSSKVNESDSAEKLRSNIPNFHWIGYAANKGKGYALRKGVEAANASYIIYTDIDWPYTEESMAGLITALVGKADAVIGTRDSTYSVSLPSSRKKIYRLLKKMNARFFRLKVPDTQAGLKGFRKEVKAIFLSTRTNRYLFDLEFIRLLSRHKDLVIIPYPVYLREGITFSNMDRKILLQESLNFLKIWLTS